MTASSARKRDIRAYAAEHNVSYTAAMRLLDEISAVSEGQRLSVLGTPPQGEADELIATVRSHVRSLLRDDYKPELWTAPKSYLDQTAYQRADPVHVLRWKDPEDPFRSPYSMETDASGFVLGQDFWRGNPLLVVGFTANTTSVEAVDVDWFEAVAEPGKVLGMAPVFAQTLGEWYVHPRLVIEESEPVTASTPVLRHARPLLAKFTIFGEKRDGKPIQMVADVGQWFGTLTTRQVRDVIRMGWSWLEQPDARDFTNGDSEKKPVDDSTDQLSLTTLVIQRETRLDEIRRKTPAISKPGSPEYAAELEVFSSARDDIVEAIDVGIDEERRSWRPGDSEVIDYTILVEVVLDHDQAREWLAVSRLSHLLDEPTDR